METLGLTVKGVTTHPDAEVEYLAGVNGVSDRGVAAGRPSLAKDTHAAEAILALSGTTNGRLAVEGFEALQRRTGTELVDLAAENEGKRITFADTQSRPMPVNTSPEWSGSGDRWQALLAVHHQHRAAQALAHAHRAPALLSRPRLDGRDGEQLPTFRPPLDMTALFDEPAVGDTSGGITVRYLTPHSKWSIHSAYQDNLYMLTLSRGGQAIWMSDVDAAKIGVKDNDWIECTNRNGVVNARAIVSHRMPEGLVFMYHAQDKAVDVPRTEKTGKRGGIHNALTRIMIKPTHLIGGYAQQSFALNYHGPTGNQRDEVTTIRRRSQEVEY